MSRYFVLLFFGVSLGWLEAKAAPTLYLKSQIEVAKDFLVLGDFIDTQRSGGELNPEVANIPMGAAPRFNEVRRYSDSGLKSLLRYQIGLKQRELGKTLVADSSFGIPVEVVVKGVGARISEMLLMKKMKSELAERFPGARVEISRLSFATSRDYPRNARFRIQFSSQVVQGPFMGDVLVEADGKKLDRVAFQGQVKIYKEVVVSKRSKSIGERFVDEDFAVQEREVSSILDGLPQPNEVIGRKLKRSVRADQVITFSDLVKEPTVARGETVDVVIGKGAFKAILRGVVQEPGMVGDRIRVLNPMSQKQISALVVAKGLVEAN